MLTPGVVAQEWAAPPQDQSSLKGSDVLLTCGISGRTEANSIVLWQQFYHNGTLVNNFFSNNNSWTNNPRYSVQPHASIQGVEGFDLKITQLEEFDDKIYQCDVLQFESLRATVTVLGKILSHSFSGFITQQRHRKLLIVTNQVRISRKSSFCHTPVRLTTPCFKPLPCATL